MLDDVTVWLRNSRNTHIAQYFKKWRQSDNEIWSFNRMQYEKSFAKFDAETNPIPFPKKLKLSISLII